MSHTIPKSNNTPQLEQEQIQQEWQHARAERQLEVQIADLADRLLILRHVREWRYSR